MGHVVIIGGGFAGLTAARRLARTKGFEVTLVDGRGACHFLPMLPDVVGRRMPAELLQWDHAREAKAAGYDALRASAERIDLTARRVRTELRDLSYDWLLLATGTQTHFHGRDDLRARCFALDTADDAVRLRDAVDAGDYEQVVVVGGGYTGVEIAAAIRANQTRRDQATPVTIIERGPTVLRALPARMQNYAAQNLEHMDITVAANESVGSIAFGCVHLASGRKLEDCLTVWAAGVTTPALIHGLPCERIANGRLAVDEMLRVDDHCFAAGDAAGFPQGDAPLRMAFQFALTGGLAAAANIIRAAKGKPLKPWRPRDLGIVVPMANKRSCGRALGVPVGGIAATMLHYAMCTVRTYGWRHRIGVLRESLRILFT